MSQSNTRDFIVEHLVQTNNQYQASEDEVEAFMRSYFDAMFQVDSAFNADESQDRDASAYAQKKLDTQKSYWAHPTAFSDYWRPSLSWPSAYRTDAQRVFSVKQDMMGNFVTLVGPSNDKFHGEEAYLIATVNGELRIVNKFF